MPLSLDQYACEFLPGRGLPWPAMPVVQPIKAKPKLKRLPIRGVLWTCYGTLLAISTGELQFEADIEFVTDMALEKTIQEFKMWNSMSRKPGAPSAYMKELFKKAYDIVRLTGQGEVKAELIWDDIVKKLMTKEYAFDATTYGPQADYVKKIAYFYHASIQGTGAYPGAAEALRIVAGAGLPQGLCADGQCFTQVQLKKALLEQDPSFDLAAHLPASLATLSCSVGSKKPGDAIFKAALASFRARGLSAEEILHVGSNLVRDIAPAKKFGMKTALFAGDRGSLNATSEQMDDPALRPDVLLTELTQIVDVIGE